MPKLQFKKERLYSGLFICEECDIEYDLDRVPEQYVICDECKGELIEVDEDEE
jgi:transcription initiation factor IIE alpha subunit